ncbi:MAG TPA: hypothetical protein VEB21_09935 [Terriglobales bacterium]|nr:hypothetical protein [Terriglobales bacterium]
MNRRAGWVNENPLSKDVTFGIGFAPWRETLLACAHGRATLA